MTTCSVLRCPAISTGIFKLMQGSNLEVPVCGEHKAVLENGAQWMVTGAGSETEPGGSGGIRILLGADLPKNNRLSGFGISRTMADEPGFTLELDIEFPEGPRQISLWISEDVGNLLASKLSKPERPAS